MTTTSEPPALAAPDDPNAPADDSAPAPAAPVRIFARPYRSLSIGSIALAALVAYEALAVSTAMPSVARSLDGVALYALAFGGTMAASVVGMAIGGVWNDRRGPVRPMWIGLALFLVGLLIAGAATNMWSLIGGRVVQGLGGGVFNVSLYVLVGRAFPEAMRPKMFAAFAAAWVVPSIVGPAITGVIVEHASWRLVFLGMPLLAIPASLLIRQGLRGTDTDVPGEVSRRDAARRIGWALAAGTGAALLQYGGQLRGVLAVVTLVAALGVIAAAVPRLLPRGTVRFGRGLPTVVAMRGVAASAFAAADVFVPLMLSKERGLSPSLAGLTLTVGAVFWSTGSWLQARPNLRLGRPALMRLGMISLTVGIAIVALALVPAVPVVVAMAGWSFAGLGMGLVYPLFSVLTLEMSPTSEQGANSAALQLADAVGTASLLAVTGSVFAALLSHGTIAFVPIYAVAAGLALIGALGAHRIVPKAA
ncbi:MFS transporter [Actinorhabdospora filicis]|uniref:MFS transporter n=1 Tax=Actinorhabdospora filicis TaxID=1785913 RepID=UPI002557149B|nr:MFS transporter [Actinorhabdospora filicis]